VTVATPVKLLLWVVLLALAIVALFTWVFPWVESWQQDPSIGTAAQLLRAPR
jgi:hypothetical protein